MKDDATRLESLVPNEGVSSELRLPVELDEGSNSFGVDKDEGVDLGKRIEDEKGQLRLKSRRGKEKGRTPKPCIIRRDLGMPRSLVCHINM